MTQAISGSCLCGTVRFEVSGGFDAFFLCHCSRCRKGSGSAHAANLFSSSAAVAWLAGREQVKSWRVPESRHERSFCGACGSALPGVQMDGALLVVPAGCLDDPIAIQPTAHISCASRADWDDGLEHVARLDGLPG
ncbi:MAG: GFA family protein [Sphingopyxis sp.]|uniref:GFA family protein n=1 Tax=Sphingopyxis sp. TaxID=1908224 RepID=UPI002ABA541B|nr:GFA family protein [Sphingopyxis sp.]MDZ3831513.1 GFA family protein [Sphingopyxis sp.]